MITHDTNLIISYKAKDFIQEKNTKQKSNNCCFLFNLKKQEKKRLWTVVYYLCSYICSSHFKIYLCVCTSYLSRAIYSSRNLMTKSIQKKTAAYEFSSFSCSSSLMYVRLFVFFSSFLFFRLVLLFFFCVLNKTKTIFNYEEKK